MAKLYAVIVVESDIWINTLQRHANEEIMVFDRGDGYWQRYPLSKDLQNYYSKNNYKPLKTFTKESHPEEFL